MKKNNSIVLLSFTIIALFLGGAWFLSMYMSFLNIDLGLSGTEGTLAIAVLFTVLLIIYLREIVKNKKISSGNKVVWIVITLMTIPIVVMLVYWFMHIKNSTTESTYIME